MAVLRCCRTVMTLVEMRSMQGQELKLRLKDLRTLKDPPESSWLQPLAETYHPVAVQRLTRSRSWLHLQLSVCGGELSEGQSHQ